MPCTAAGVDCRLRYLYCLRPYGSPPPVVARLPQPPLSQNTDSFLFEDGFIVVGGQDNSWNRSNPFTRELQRWPVKLYQVLFSCMVFSCGYINYREEHSSTLLPMVSGKGVVNQLYWTGSRLTWSSVFLVPQQGQHIVGFIMLQCLTWASELPVQRTTMALSAMCSVWRSQDSSHVTMMAPRCV